jgi:hypothetical protein
MFLAGIRDRTALTDVLDIITVILMECPGETLRTFRSGLDRALTAAAVHAHRDHHGDPAALRATWGLQPHQIEAHRRFHQQLSGGG